MKPKQAQREELWRERIAQQEKRKESVRSFCRAQGLHEQMFYYWRRRLRARKSPVEFALLNRSSVKECVEQTPAIELMLASGDCLRIPSQAAVVRMVLNVLREQRQA